MKSSHIAAAGRRFGGFCRLRKNPERPRLNKVLSRFAKIAPATPMLKPRPITPRAPSTAAPKRRKPRIVLLISPAPQDTPRIAFRLPFLFEPVRVRQSPQFWVRVAAPWQPPEII